MRVPLVTFGFLFMTSFALAQAPRRVACIGDSITYGDRLADRGVQSYPAVLERLSQGRFAVGNFGVNGATALDVPFRAWRDAPACREAIDFNPDVAVVMLGINDLLGFRERLDEYPAALRDVVSRFQALPSAPRVLLCTLTPIAPPEQAQDVNRAIRDTLNPAIRAVAAETGAAIVDVSAIYPNRLDLLPDGLHPAPEGAELIARAVLAALDASSAPPLQIQPAPVSGPVDISVRNEAYAAKGRAEKWMKNQSKPVDLRDPRANTDAADLLPLLSGRSVRTNESLTFSYAALASALDRAGQETVFLDDGRPVAWREALLHRLVQCQRIDATGGGFWTDPISNDSVRSTAYALQAMAIVLGE